MGRRPARTRHWCWAPRGSRGPVTALMRRAMTAADLQGRLQEAIHELTDSRAQTGVQVAVIRHGARSDGRDHLPGT